MLTAQLSTMSNQPGRLYIRSRNVVRKVKKNPTRSIKHIKVCFVRAGLSKDGKLFIRYIMFSTVVYTSTPFSYVSDSYIC